MGDVFRVEFVLDAGFAQDEDGALALGEGEDARDVDGGAVGGAEDFVLLGREERGLAVRGDVEGAKGKGKGRRGVMTGGIPLLRGCPWYPVSSCSRRGIWCCCS